MLRHFAALAILSSLLSGCSYGYDMLATTRGGRIVFIVDPKSNQHPSCLRQIDVVAEGDVKAVAEAGDDTSRVGYGTFWFESVDYEDDCLNQFPLPYGEPLKGRPQEDRRTVRPKPLLREVVYTIAATTGATGYGSGRFVIHPDGQIENLAFPENSPGTADAAP